MRQVFLCRLLPDSLNKHCNQHNYVTSAYRNLWCVTLQLAWKPFWQVLHDVMFLKCFEGWKGTQELCTEWHFGIATSFHAPGNSPLSLAKTSCDSPQICWSTSWHSYNHKRTWASDGMLRWNAKDSYLQAQCISSRYAWPSYQACVVVLAALLATSSNAGVRTRLAI